MPGEVLSFVFSSQDSLVSSSCGDNGAGAGANSPLHERVYLDSGLKPLEFLLRFLSRVCVQEFYEGK